MTMPADLSRRCEMAELLKVRAASLELAAWLQAHPHPL
jgi:hypothetical protein